MRAFSQEAAICDSLPFGVTVQLTSVGDEPSALDLAVLTAAERARAQSFVFAADRARFVTARAMLRRALADLLGCEPGAVPIQVDAHGRPYLEGSDLDFNVSHSGGMAAVALTKGRRVGIDVEAHRKDRRLRELLPDVMSTAERELLEPLEGDAFHDAFYACWTRKEAIAKALGSGLAQPLPLLDVPQGGVIHVENESRRRAFQVRTTVLTSGFTLSLAAETTHDTGGRLWL